MRTIIAAFNIKLTIFALLDEKEIKRGAAICKSKERLNSTGTACKDLQI